MPKITRCRTNSFVYCTKQIRKAPRGIQALGRSTFGCRLSEIASLRTSRACETITVAPTLSPETTVFVTKYKSFVRVHPRLTTLSCRVGRTICSTNKNTKYLRRLPYSATIACEVVVLHRFLVVTKVMFALFAMYKQKPSLHVRSSGHGQGTASPSLRSPFWQVSIPRSIYSRPGP